MSGKFKKITSIILSFLMIFTMIPKDAMYSFAAPVNIVIDAFEYVQTNDNGNTSVRVTIRGSNFIQVLSGTKEESVIKDILVSSGAESKSLMQNAKDVKVSVSDSIITIVAPKTGELSNLNINTNDKNEITINTKQLPTNTYKFNAQINDLPSMAGSLDNKKNYVGQDIKIKGSNFDGVTTTVIAGASHITGKEATVQKDLITISPLKKGTLNKSEKIQFIKVDNTSNATGAVKPDIKFTVEYTDKILVFEKLEGMDNLEVLPEEGPAKVSSKITVRANDKDGKLLKNIFNANNRLFLRKEVNGKETELELNNVKLVRENPNDPTSTVIAIEGWTPIWGGTVPYNMDLVVKDVSNPTSEGIKYGAYTFVSSNPAPQITGITPTEGPDTGGTEVLINGKNIINVNTPGRKMGTSDKITPKAATKVEGADTLVVDYDVAGTPTYGGKKITGVQRKIKVRIASMTSAKAGNIRLEANIPKPGVNFEGKGYGKYHYSADGADGIMVTTTNASTSGAQDVILEMDTIFTLENGATVTIPEATKYTPFTYNEKNPTPKITGVDYEYGYFNDVKEEEDPPAGGAGDNIKPLMLRIKGEKFEAYMEDGKMKYPTVQFVLPDGTVVPAVSSTAENDTKVLDDKGSPIDGVYNKTGSTLVMSIIPKTSSEALRRLVSARPEEAGSYKNYEVIIQVTNPSGNSNTAGADGTKFTFRRPVEGDFTGVHSKQIEISSVISNGSPIKKMPSDADTPVDIKVKATGGITDSKKLVLTVDGKDISKNIKGTKIEGEETIISATVPKGFIGKTRLQVITPEGLMDSYQIIFDNVRGPEIKELIPVEGDKGTIVIIKRDTQANEVSFKVPIKDGKTEAEQIGSKVLWNGVDINEQFNGYNKSNGTLKYQESPDFKAFKQTNKGETAGKVSVPGKYVYVVDADTIYLKIPNEEALKEGTYDIKIKNPDGSESSIGKEFKIVDVIDKTKIGSISPNTDDTKGGIITTIKAGEKDGIKTNFKGGIDVYIASQKAEVVGYDINNTEAYVKVPPLVDFKFPKTLDDKVASYTVPVTIQNKVNKSTDTLNDGFIYLNPNYTMDVTQVYNEKYSTDPENKDANKGVEGDFVIIRGKNLRLETDSNGKPVLPKVMFGHTLADAVVGYGAKNVKPDGSPQLDAQGRAELEWIKVKVPKEPTLSKNTDGSVDVLVQNPDGAKVIKEKGFFYIKSSPTINEKASILQASRFHDTITVNAKDVNKNNLLVAFGNKQYEKELSSTQMDLETSKEVEKIVVRYIPNTEKNLEIYYKKPDGTLVLMIDTENTDGGKTKLGAIGDKIVVGLNWKNPAYHSTDITKNPELLNSLNKEYMTITATNKAPNVNTLIVRRGLGKVIDFKLDPATSDSVITINTPYNDKTEKTTITLINADGSSATAPFEFHGGLRGPSITNIDGSKDRDLTIEGKPVKAKVYTSDYTEDTEITVEGENFKDIDRVMVGSKDAEVLSVSTDYKKLKIRVPKGTQDEIGVPLPITVVTKDGTGYSDKSNPPVYFMYIKAGAKPILTSITPAKGPQTGGTKVTIMGSNFRDIDEFGTKGNIEVYFGGVKGIVNRKITNEKGEIIGIEATTPSVETIDTAGTTAVVKNADEGRSAGIPFKYISQPVIEKIDGNFELYGEASADGDTVKVTIIGKNFYDPSRIILGGKIINVDANKDAKDDGLMLGVKSDGSNQYVELEKDKTGTEKGLSIPVDASTDKNTTPANNTNKKDKTEKTKNTTSFTVTMPLITFEQMEKMDGKNLIVVDADGGISNPMAVDIKLPIPNAPVVIATPGNYNTVNLSWELDKNDRRKPTRFEVYAKEEGGNNEYAHVGDIMKNTDSNNLKYNYTVKNLKPDTTYQFKVRVMNAFGEAEDFGYAKIKTLKPEDDYKQKEKLQELDRATTNVRQNGIQKVVGNTMQYTVGTKENTVILSGYTQKVKEVRIPVSQIKAAPNASIQVQDKNLRLNIPFAAFALNQVNSASDDSVVVLKLQNGDNRMNTNISRVLPKNKKRVSDVNKIDMYVQEPRKKLGIQFTAMPITINIQPNKSASVTSLTKYDEKTRKLQQNINPNITDGGYYVLLGNK